MASNLPSSATTSGAQAAAGGMRGRPPQYFSRTGMGWSNGGPAMPGPDPSQAQVAWSNPQAYQYPPSMAPIPPPMPDSSYPRPPPPMNVPHPSQPGSMYYPSSQSQSQYSQYSQQPLPPPLPPSSPPPNTAIPPPPPPSSPPPPPPPLAPPPPPPGKIKEGGVDRGRHDRDRDRDRRVSREGDQQQGLSKQHHNKPPAPSVPTNRVNGPPGGRVETEEERRVRKKKEAERQRPEDRHLQHQRESQKAHQKTHLTNSGTKGHERSSGSRMGERRTPAPLLNAERMENRLKKPTTFLCRMKFRNELPDPTAQPKLMTIKRDKDRFARYSITSLEKMHKPKLYTEPDLGIPLDLLDLSIYNPPKEKLPLDPEDEELLRDDEAPTPLRKDGLRKKERPSDQGLSWLVKTQYISPLSNEATRQSLTEKQAKELRETREGLNLLENLNSRERQIQDILTSFEACKSRPVHATNKALHPVEITPLLPFFDRHDDEFVVVNFDGEPTEDSEMFSRVDKTLRDAHESKAIMKSFTAASSEAGKPERFLGYMVPAHNEVLKDICEEDDDISYSWVREYNWEVKGENVDDPSTYLVAFDDNVARYLPLPTKLVLRKRRSKEGKSSEETEQFAPPAKVTVRRAETAAVIERKDPAAHSYLRRGASSSRGAEMDDEDGYEGMDARDAEMGQSSGADDDAYD